MKSFYLLSPFLFTFFFYLSPPISLLFTLCLLQGLYGLQRQGVPCSTLSYAPLLPELFTPLVNPPVRLLLSLQGKNQDRFSLIASS
jgi:hypothetical protein